MEIKSYHEIYERVKYLYPHLFKNEKLPASKIIDIYLKGSINKKRLSRQEKERYKKQVMSNINIRKTYAECLREEYV